LFFPFAIQSADIRYSGAVAIAAAIRYSRRRRAAATERSLMPPRYEPPHAMPPPMRFASCLYLREICKSDDIIAARVRGCHMLHFTPPSRRTPSSSAAAAISRHCHAVRHFEATAPCCCYFDAVAGLALLIRHALQAR